MEPHYSSLERKDPDWEPDWIEERFAAMLQCDEKNCGEIVVIAGDTVMVPTYSQGFEEYLEPDGLYSSLCLRSMFPAAPLFSIPKSLPTFLAKHLGLVFELFWHDLATCTSRLRLNVEMMLDDLKVPRKKKGKGLDLFHRIEEFETIFCDANNTASLKALRPIGNLGTHGLVISKDALFDALDVYEDVLLEIYEKKSDALNAIKEKLIETKGDY